MAMAMTTAATTATAAVATAVASAMVTTTTTAAVTLLLLWLRLELLLLLLLSARHHRGPEQLLLAAAGRSWGHVMGVLFSSGGAGGAGLRSEYSCVCVLAAQRACCDNVMLCPVAARDVRLRASTTFLLAAALHERAPGGRTSTAATLASCVWLASHHRTTPGGTTAT